MATANEVLEQMEQHPELYVSADVCIVDPVTRTISVPDAYRILGVESDESVKVVPFQCPKMVEDDVDLTDFTLYINYVNAGGDFDMYSIENVKESGENITFDWIIRRSVTARRGTIRFILCAKRSDDEGNIIQEWNTTINDECESLEGLEGAPSIADQYPDIIQQILEKLQEITGGGGGGTGGPVDQEQIQQAVNDYLTKNPPSGMTTEQQQQLTKNTNDITDLKNGLVLKLNIQQGIENTGKFLGVGADGNVTPVDKPTYTANEVGARPNTWMPSAEDVGALPNDTEIPSKTSDLENDSGFITGADIPEKLPNPQKIIFTGAVTAEYDGSSQQTINIPTGGSDPYTLPIMSSAQLGGGKAIEKTDEDVPVAVDPSTGQLFVPTYPESGSGASGITVSYDAEQQAIVFTNSSGMDN